VDSRCSTFQELLATSSGALDELPVEAREHVETCPSCAEVARSERALAALLAAAVPAAIPGFEQDVLAALAPRSTRRTVWSLAPVVISCSIAGAGAVLAGGVPGGSLVAHLPSVAGRGVVSVMGAASEWTTALLAAGRTMATALPLGVTVGAAALALAGTVSLAFAVRRWAPGVAWRREP